MAAKKYYGTDDNEAHYSIRVGFKDADTRKMEVEIETRNPLPSNFRTELYALVAKYAKPETKDNSKQIIP